MAQFRSRIKAATARSASVLSANDVIGFSTERAIAVLLRTYDRIAPTQL
jgi:hypothetical protein